MTNATEEIKSRLGILEVVSQYVQLKKVGHSYKGLCPFHTEKTPSFIVSPDKDIAYCFGCRKGGDIFAVVQEIEHLEFPEALRMLADRAGVVIDEAQTVKRSEREPLLSIQEAAAKQFHEQLLKSPEAEVARTYLTKRGITAETIERFRLGYALPAWDSALTALKEKKFSEAQLLSAGIIIARDGKKGGYYDRFRGRIMFPLQDMQGKLVGFSGRQVVDKEGEPKYLNSSDSAIFHKGSILYGFPMAKEPVRDQQKVLFVEGQMDVLALHQHGYTNAVATSGTALTTQHLKLVKRFATNVLFAFDADKAGKEATKRALHLAAQEEMTAGVIVAPNAKDPDELLQSDPEAWRAAYDHPLDPVSFFLDVYFSDISREDVAGKKRITAELFEYLMSCSNLVEREHYLKKASDQLGIALTILQKEFERGTGKSPARKGTTAIQPRNKFFDSEEQCLMGILLHNPALITQCDKMFEEQQHFSEPFLAVYKSLVAYYTAQADDFDVKNFLRQLTDQESASRIGVLALVAERSYGDVLEADLIQEVRSLIDLCRRKYHRKRLSSLTVAMKSAEALGDNATIRELLKQKKEEIERSAA